MTFFLCGVGFSSHDFRSVLKFFEQSLDCALRLRPRLILVCGLMGSGKTRQALELARRAGTRVVHSDVTRKRLAGLDPEHPRRLGIVLKLAVLEALLNRVRQRELPCESRGSLVLRGLLLLDMDLGCAYPLPRSGN